MSSRKRGGKRGNSASETIGWRDRVQSAGVSCAQHALRELKAALGDAACDAGVPYALRPVAGRKIDFCDRVLAFIDSHRGNPVNVVPLPLPFFKATGSPVLRRGDGTVATLATWSSGTAWSSPVKARLLAEVGRVCGADVSLLQCRLHEWIHIHSPELNKRLYPRDIVSFFLDTDPEDPDVGGAGAGAAAPAAAAPPPKSVAYPHDARLTSIAAVQACFSFDASPYFFFVAHSYARAQETLLKSVPGLDYAKTSPRIAGSTLGGGAADPHLIVIVDSHIGWKVHPHELRNNGAYPTPVLGYPFSGLPRILYQGGFDPLHP
jgi:hypothetical protein